MLVTIQEAIQLTGKSRSTIQRYIAAGKLSKTDKGIDTSELIRVFGELNRSDDKAMNQPDLAREQWLMSQIESLRAELKQVREDAARREELANEREKRLLNLLEHKSAATQTAQAENSFFLSKFFK